MTVVALGWRRGYTPSMLTLLLVACTTTIPDVWTPPGEPGPLLVATDEDAFDHAGLEIPVQIWFPASEVDEDVHVYSDLLAGTAADGGTPDCAEPRPVLVFSHGNGGVRYQSIFLTERLASRGWIVVAPDHVGNTTFDIESIPRHEVAIRRPADVAAAFDHLVSRAEDRDDRLFGCVDAAAGYAVAGHSFGGYTALATGGAPLDLAAMDAVCPGGDWLCGMQEVYRAEHGDDRGDLADPRVWAVVAHAPVGKTQLDNGGITVPTMVIGAKNDTLTPWESEVKPIAEELTVADRALVGIANVGHYQFTDFCVDSFPNCDVAEPSISETHALINELTTAWLDVHRGEARSAAALPPTDAWLEWVALD